jgi:hypothetical protein
MMPKNIFISMIVITAFISCIPEAKNNMPTSNEVSNTVYDNSIIDLRKLDKTLRAMLVLYTQEERSTRSNGETAIRTIDEGDFGIPDGENWLVEWAYTKADYNTNIILYAIKDDIIVKRYYLGENFKWRNYSEFNIMSFMDHMSVNKLGDRTGTIVWSNEFTRDNKYFVEGGRYYSVPYDISKQSYFNFFRYSFHSNNYGIETFIEILGYDKETDGIKTHLRVPTTLFDHEKGPAPVAFIWNNGMYGVIIYTRQDEGERRSNDYKWIFHIWDLEQRKFIEIGEVVGYDNNR